MNASFMSSVLKDLLHLKNVPMSRTTPYNLAANKQCERHRATIWKITTAQTRKCFKEPTKGLIC